jgi:hypothetical protein
VTRIDRDDDSTVQSLARAMQLLELLATDDKGYRLVDIAAGVAHIGGASYEAGIATGRLWAGRGEAL